MKTEYIVKSTFKNRDSITSEEYTAAWIALINRLERANSCDSLNPSAAVCPVPRKDVTR